MIDVNMKGETKAAQFSCPKPRFDISPQGLFSGCREETLEVQVENQSLMLP